MTIKKMIPIWFFVGGLITIYGVLILAAGVHEYSLPQGSTVAMQNLHLQIWWGIGMLILGIIYLVRFRPGH